MNMLSEQERAARMATIARSESKVFFRKKLLPFAVVMSVLFTTLLWWNSLPERPTPVAEVEKPRVAEQKVPAVQQPQVMEAQWDGGRPVVGQWSKTFQIPVGCRARFNDGNGTAYRVRLRTFGDRHWVEHVPGNSMNGSEVQFMLLQEESGVPFTIKCS